MCVLLPKRPNSGLSPELHPREINRLRRRRFSLAYFWPAKVSDTAPLSGRFVFRPPNRPPTIATAWIEIALLPILVSFD